MIETLVSLVKDRLDIFLISEIRIDQSFPPAQFTINGYRDPFRRDRDSEPTLHLLSTELIADIFGHIFGN